MLRNLNMRCVHNLIMVGIIGLTISMMPGAAEAAELYVDNVRGDDVSGTGGRDSPFRTIARALQDLRGGDTLNLVPNAKPYREPLELRDEKVELLEQEWFKEHREINMEIRDANRYNGTPENPTVIDGHGSTISHLVHHRAGAWKDEGDGFFSMSLPNNAWIFNEQGYWSGFPIVFFDGEGGQWRKTRDELQALEYCLFKKTNAQRAAEREAGKALFPAHDTLFIRLPEGRTPDDIRVEAAGPGTVGITGSFVVVRNLTSSYSTSDGFWTYWSRGVVFDNVRGSFNMDQGISNHGSEAVVRNSRFDNNAGRGIVEVHEPCRVRYENCIIENDVFRGGAEFHDGVYEMIDCIIRNNQGPDAITVARGATVTLRNCVIIGTPEKSGTGVRSDAGSTLIMEQCTVFGFDTGFVLSKGKIVNSAFLACARHRIAGRTEENVVIDHNFYEPAEIRIGSRVYCAESWDVYVGESGLDGNSLSRRMEGDVSPCFLPELSGKGKDGADIGARLDSDPDVPPDCTGDADKK